jgi:spore germination protein GerM
MENERLPDENGIVSKSGMQWWHFLILVCVALVMVASIIYYSFVRERVRKPQVRRERIIEVPEGSKAVTLFFADKENESLVSETRQVAIGKEFTEEVKQIMNALLEGPEYSGVSAIPAGTKILDVFYDTGRATLYLDFSAELVAGHPGGSAAEYYTIAAIMKTVSENFPEVKAVQFLVEGLQMGTVGGHINASDPFLVRDWR